MDKYIGSFVRHGLTVLSGYLLAKGVAIPSEGVEAVASGATEILGALATYGIAQAWSFFEKAKSKVKF